MRSRCRARFWVAAAVAAAALALCAGSPRAASGQKWAILVGVDRYESDQISALRYAGSDARDVAKALVEVGGWPADNVVVMSSSSDTRNQPTSTNVLERLEGMRAVVKRGDSFVFFFSGHGVDIDGKSYLLTREANAGSARLLARSSLPVKEVREALAELSASRVLVLVDACRNDPRSGKGAKDNLMSKGFARDLKVVPKRGAAEVEVAATVYSCRVGERSYEGYKNHGFFSYFLVRGMRGAAAVNGRVATMVCPRAFSASSRSGSKSGSATTSSGCHW